MSLPPTLFNFAAHNENPSVERLLVESLGATAKARLRVLVVSGCGTNAITMCGSPDVERVDAVDPAPAQLRLGALLRTVVGVVDSPEEFARFMGNDGEPSERAALYDRLRSHAEPEVRKYWDANVDTVTAGVLACGGAERCLSIFRDNLPSSDLRVLARDPDGVLAALRAGITMETQRDNMMIPEAAMQNIVEHGVPGIAASLSARLEECADADPDFIVELIVRGHFVMDPVASRAPFLRPDVFAEIQQNGCGPERLAFHEGPMQVVGPSLAERGGAYDLIDMSNILDMAPPDEAEGSLRAVARAAKPGATIVCRSHGAAGALEPVFVASGLKVDAELSRQARAAETSFFMNEVCVART